MHINLFRYFFITISVLLLNACINNEESETSESNRSEVVSRVTPLPDGTVEKPIANELRDWQTIQQSGVIRALKLAWEEETSLPRSGGSNLQHIELLNQFASKHQLKIEWVKVKNLAEMFSALSRDEADIIPRHLTITRQRNNKMLFTQALATDSEVLIVHKDTKQELPEFSAETKLEVTLPADTAYIETIRQDYPQWKLRTISESLSADAIVDGLVEGQFKYSVIDGLSAKTLLEYRDDFVVAFELAKKQQLAWAVNLSNDSLVNKINEFIAEHHITTTSSEKRTYDLNQLQQKKLTLRMITRNSPETYFLWRGELKGFEYELMREFAKRQKLRLEVIVADNYQQMEQLLKEGQGDVIAAGISRTENRKSSLKFSFRYNRVAELLVANKNNQPIQQFEDLKNRTIFIRQSSAFWDTAQQLVKDYGVKLVAVDENYSTELLIGQVNNGEIDLTIADSNLINIEKRFSDNLSTPLVLKEDVPHAYAVRNNNSELLNALNQFIKKEYRGTFYNVVKNKYFSNEKRLKQYREKRITEDSGLSPYDSLVKQYARLYQFDWRLITAQMFQESRFDPLAKSSAGAQGLMQLLPRTANEMGFTDLTKPQESIAAGTQYLQWTSERFANDMPLSEKIYFALAAYNAGFGHVKDAQRLAKRMNLRSDKWFNHVEKAMLLLQKPEYYKKSRFGYCRGSEPVNYVREIQQRYLSYIKITG